MRVLLTVASAVLASAVACVAQPAPSNGAGVPQARDGGARARDEKTYLVEFRLRGYVGAGGVALAGSFNDWRPAEMGFARNGEWLSRRELKPGRHLYRFVVGGRSMTDPLNLDAEADASGNVNSVLVVEPGPGRVPKTNLPSAAEARRLDVLDALVDVGRGRRLHINCAGRARPAQPTVVMEAGHTNYSQSWFKVRPALVRVARVCVYDRAGMGLSDPPARPARTADDLVSDLHTLLERAGVRGPLVLVGHSLGGILVRHYASRHPERVRGMVLVDSSHEEQDKRYAALIPPEVAATFTEEERRVQSPEGLDLEAGLEPVRAARWRARVPLVVLTAGRTEADPNPDPRIAPYLAKFEEIRVELQKELATRSPRGRQVVAARSGHFIHWDEPELVIDAVRQVVREATRARGGK